MCGAGFKALPRLIAMSPVEAGQGERVRGTLEETLNAMLAAKVNKLYGAGRYHFVQR